jgi:hypothetical protein
MDQPELRTVESSSALGQKLSAPPTPQAKAVVSVKIVKNPKPKLQAIQPSREAHKFKIKLETKKQNGIVFTELRSVIESGGGTIIAWDNRNKMVLAVIGGKKIKLRINGKTAVIDEQSVEMISAPYVNAHGRMVVDVQFLKSLVGTRLEVNQSTGKCTLVAS